jgi:hypothetical protein
MAPSMVDAKVSVVSLVLPVPLINGASVAGNPDLDDVLSEASRAATGYDVTYEAIARSALAIARDPSSVQARFAQACLLAKHGLHDLARLVLQSLRDAPSCPACVDALLNVGDTCGFDAAARALAADTTPSATRLAAQTILASLAKGDPVGLAGLVGANVSVQGICSVCDGDVDDSVTKHVPPSFDDFVRQGDGPEGGSLWRRGPVFLFCDRQCCTGPPGMLSHSSSIVIEMCFSGGERAPKLRSLTTVDG